jgi:hypothetical protein
LNLDDEVRKGNEAKYLMEHPLLVEAFAAIREEFRKSWENSPVRDVEGRELIFLGTKILNQLEGALQSHITTGKLAAFQLQALGKGNTDELH